MLAPRKNLWTTPSEAIDGAISLLKPTKDDVIYDIGCGEGQFLISCGLNFSNSQLPEIIGVEIDEERSKLAKGRIEEAGLSPDSVKVVLGNALEIDYSRATCIFMYLIPRGLRIIFPTLKKIPHKVRIVTFMNPLPDISPIDIQRISTAKHPEAQWPLFYYEINNESNI